MPCTLRVRDDYESGIDSICLGSEKRVSVLLRKQGNGAKTSTGWLDQHMRQAQAEPVGTSAEIVRVLFSERSRMPFDRLPVQSHYVEIVVELDRFSNHTLFLIIGPYRATHIDWGNSYSVKE
jgi:hypothetical protein